MSHTRNIVVEFKNRHVTPSLVHEIYSRSITAPLKGELGAIVIIARSFTSNAIVTAENIRKELRKQKRDLKLILIEAKSDAEHDSLREQFYADPLAALQAYSKAPSN